MARMTRAEMFSPDEIAIVHVMNRTVRRCYLMGDDPLTGKNYDHRKAWMENELRRLASFFGIDLLGYAIMSNHFHLILRSRPDVVATWDDTEVARRWLMLCPPPRKKSKEQPEGPTEAELNMIRRNKTKLAAIRSRLSHISWWMRLLSQIIAQRANRDDKETGKFWQARYRAVKILDEMALLACAAYVDLNPIRAAMAETLESSHYTSVQKRIQSLQQHVKSRSRSESDPSSRSTRGQQNVGKAQTSELFRLMDSHLAPVEIDERRERVSPRCHTEGYRASDRGFLAMPTAAYIELLDWTARQIRSGKRGSTPKTARPLFDRLGISSDTWCELVKDFGQLFIAVAGKPQQIASARSRSGRRRFNTRPRVRELFEG